MSNLTNAQSLKSLSTQQKKVLSRIADLKKDLHITEQELCTQKKILTDINNSISKLNLTPEVSEHAILQYLIRYCNLDVTSIIESILTPELTSQIDCLNSGKFPIYDGLVAVVKNKTVVTITK